MLTIQPARPGWHTWDFSVDAYAIARFRRGDLVFINSLLAITMTKTTMSNRWSRRSLWLKTKRPYLVIKVHDEHVNGGWQQNRQRIIHWRGILGRNKWWSDFLQNNNDFGKHDEGLQSKKCPSLHSVCDDEPSKSAVSKLLEEHQKNVRTPNRALVWVQTRWERMWGQQAHLVTL